MNDVELARLISDEIGSRFALAKEVADEYPEYSLVTLRAVCKLICQQIILTRKLAIPREADLDTLIREVCDRTNPNTQTRDAFHKLRHWGNKGAHPEEGKYENLNLVTVCRLALDYAIDLLKFAHAQIHPGARLPSDIKRSVTGSGMKSLCYRATIEEEAEDQYWLGKHFLDKAMDVEHDDSAQMTLPYLSHEEKRKANYWFRLAANQGHAAALYEHGRLLVGQVEGKEYICLGVNNLFRAAAEGNPDANATVGHIYYNGGYDQPQDFSEARRHFEIAARDDHPSALMALGVMYFHGEGGPADAKIAFEYTKKSADAGYASGQYNLFVHYFRGTAVERNEAEGLAWLVKAADQCFPDALISLAEIITDGSVPGKSLTDAESLLLKCMSTAPDTALQSKAAFLYAQLLSRHADELSQLTHAADVLQRCYEAEEGQGTVAQACIELSVEVVKSIKKLIEFRLGTAEELTAAGIIIAYMFDKSGKPVLRRQDGFRDFTESLRKASNPKNQTSPEQYQTRLLQSFIPDLPKRPAQRQARIANTKVGRNDLCPCNSGRKYKHCCGGA